MPEAAVAAPQCSLSNGDHSCEHRHFDIDPVEIVRCLRWHSNVVAEVQGPHPGRYVMRLHLQLGEEDEGDNTFALCDRATVPPDRYREAHRDLLQATAVHLRRMAQEMEDSAAATMSRPPIDIGPVGVGGMERGVCVSSGWSPR